MEQLVKKISRNIVSLSLILSLFVTSCTSSFVKATFGNRNVYKTKSNLTVKKVYEKVGPSTDLRDFTINPNPIPTITKTTTVQTTQSATIGAAPVTSTNITMSTIPPTTISSTISLTPGGSLTSNPAVSSTTNYTIYSVPLPTPNTKYIRYKVVADDGDFKYIKILPGCHFVGTSPTDTLIQALPAGTSLPAGSSNPSDFVFQVSKKSLMPGTHYLASSALIGKITTLPVRVRNEYWNNNNKVIQGSLAIGYSFGYKLKLGNNPYKPHYANIILYGAGISQQKYFSIVKDQITGKESAGTKSDEIAITYLSFGLAYEFDKFNIGIFAGKDKMFGTLKNWAYQDAWWWGIGAGYELFK